jgi:hypothetical protein
VPQHTTAERRHAAAERERQHQAEQRHNQWLRRVTGPTVVTVGAAAGLVLGAPTASGVFQHYHPYSAASQPFPYIPFDPDPPHTPEPDMTFYTAYDGSGTATTTTLIGPVAESWNPWEWVYGPNVLGD